MNSSTYYAAVFSDQKDSEAALPAPPQHTEKSKLEVEAKLESPNETLNSNPNLVKFAPDNPGNHKNWSLRRRWLLTVLISCYTFILPVSSSVVALALPYIRKDFQITSSIAEQIVLSIFVLSFTIGPLVLGPLSEVYGQVPVLQVGNLIYLIFRIACVLSRTMPQMVIAYSLYAASAISAATFLPEIAGFGLPLLGPKLCENLGYEEAMACWLESSYVWMALLRLFCGGGGHG